MTEVDADGPFGDLRRALRRLPDDQEEGLRSGPRVRADPNRQRRTGIPEVVHAENKPAGDVADALRRLVAAHGRALASRVPEASVAEIRTALAPELVVEEHCLARAIVASRLSVNDQCGADGLPSSAQARRMCRWRWRPR
jgi:NCAIR mutase (PurE)-related protein